VNKHLLKILQFAATFGLLGLVFYQAGLFTQEGQERFLGTLVKASPVFLCLSVLIGVLVNMVSALKWYMLTQTQSLGAGYWRIFAYYVVGQFYNMFLPTSVGGDVVRSYELGKFSGRQAAALASVFVERYTGVLTLLLFALLAVLLQLSRFDEGFVLMSLALFAFILAVVGWLVFDQRLYRAVRQWATDRAPASQQVFSKLDKLLEAVDAYRGESRAIALAFFNSGLFYIAATINVYITSLVFNLDVSFIDMLVATPIIMVIMNLPISFGNIGLMEFAYTNVFLLLGYGVELGLSVAILMRLKSFLDGALGGVLHPIFVTQKHE